MSLRKINNVLLGLIIVINIYVIGAPLAPQVMYWWQSNHSSKKQDLIKKVQAKQAKPTEPQKAVANSVIVPSMLLDRPILEGPVRDTYKILDQGIWRWPLGSTPDKGGNTVLIGHRFTYTQPQGVFYFLNKVQMDDQIGLLWNNQKYVYKVTEIKEVPPTETSVQDPTTDARLTMYTCTPLWMPKNRLVVIAELVESEES